LIGAQVAFSITHSGDGARRFGHVFTLDGEDIRETIVSNGWAEVKPQPAGEKKYVLMLAICGREFTLDDGLLGEKKANDWSRF
jgi:endonuclease YncB( thermonuclease family)